MFGSADEHQATSRPERSLMCCDEDGQAAAVHEGQRPKVDNDESGTGERVLEARGEVWRDGEIELATDGEPCRVATAMPQLASEGCRTLRTECRWGLTTELGEPHEVTPGFADGYLGSQSMLPTRSVDLTSSPPGWVVYPLKGRPAPLPSLLSGCGTTDLGGSHCAARRPPGAAPVFGRAAGGVVSEWGTVQTSLVRVPPGHQGARTLRSRISSFAPASSALRPVLDVRGRRSHPCWSGSSRAPIGCPGAIAWGD